MSWLKRGTRVRWPGYEGVIVGPNALFGTKGRNKGWQIVDIWIERSATWEGKLSIGYVRMIQLHKGQFEIRHNGQWRKVS